MHLLDRVFNLTTRIGRATLLMALIALAAPAQAEVYSSGTVTILVPYAPGGSADIVGRLLAAHLQERFGQSVVVENRVGGSEISATEALARSNPDGQTIAILSNALSINDTLVPTRRYDVARDLVGVARMIELPFALVVHPSVPAQSLKELVALARAQPGRLNYGHLGPGSPHFFAMEWFKRATGTEIVAVPYRGAAPAYAALVMNEVQMIASGLSAATPFLESKQARALAAFSDKRPTSRPDLPTVSEAGLPTFNLLSWMGVFVRAGTPDAKLAMLEREVKAFVEQQQMRVRLDQLGLEPAFVGREGFMPYVLRDIENWREVVVATK